MVIIMKNERINELRHYSRKLVRELGMLQLNKNHLKQTPQHWHTLIEISKEPGITVSQLGHMLLLSTSQMSRIVNALLKADFIYSKDGIDKREKYFYLTEKGQQEMNNIDTFSNAKIKGAFEYLTQDDQDQIIAAIQKYSQAIEKSRLVLEQVKILTLSTARPIRKQIVSMIENIQKNEFQIPVTDEINAGVLRAEDEYYYNNSYNFWYAIDNDGAVIGSVGLKMLDDNNAEIKKFFVAKPYRGKEVAQKLMKTLIKSANKHGFNHLFLGTVDILHAAHRFYDKYGFSRIDKQKLHSKFEICPVDTVFFKMKIAA